MRGPLTVVHIIISIILIGLILLQSSQGGLSAMGGGEFYRSKRGAERVVFLATIVFTVLFLLTSVTNLLVR